jgi:hypothetical protein
MKVKGTALAVVTDFIRGKFGPEGLERWLGALAPEAARAYREGIQINHWYPLRELYLEPTAVMCQLFFGGDPGAAREIGRFSADFALKGVYKAFVKMTSVNFFIKRASLLMTTYYQPSRMELASLGNNRAVLHLTEFPEPHPLIEARIAGWVERALEIHGCREVKVDIVRSLTTGAPLTELVLTWK